MNEWNGEERRSNTRDHDLIVEIHAIVDRMESTMGKHVEEDKKDFIDVHKRINKLNWYVGVGVGIVTAFEAFITKFSK